MGLSLMNEDDPTLCSRASWLTSMLKLVTAAESEAVPEMAALLVDVRAMLLQPVVLASFVT
ncbi:MAG: hypothetical protein IPJ18_10870 [Betaproteobacteria bacterium]|nr:hypothetical protein [Betaproteobacteria bacterium]